MADVLDLRQFRASQLEALLAAESLEWDRTLDWDYAPSAELIRQYVESRVLPGYVLTGGGRRREPLGYGFYIHEAHKGMVGNLFIAPQHRDSARSAEITLLRHMLATMCATPGMDRIEAQLMVYRPEVLGECFLAHGFRRFRRLFLVLGLGADPTAGLPPIAAPADIRLEPWGGASYDEAAQLIQLAYTGHIDSNINDQYRSLSGALRFMHNIAHYPGCGTFDADASLLARSVTGRLEGMILTSRVKPGVAHITQVCVEPAQQGRGLGRLLLERALARLRERGARAVTLTVTSNNPAAEALYRRLGFLTLTEFDAYTWDRP